MINFDSVSNEEPQSAKFAGFSPDRPQTKIVELTTLVPDFFVTKLDLLDGCRVRAAQGHLGHAGERDHETRGCRWDDFSMRSSSRPTIR